MVLPINCRVAPTQIDEETHPRVATDAGSRVVQYRFRLRIEISYIQLVSGLVVGGGFEPPKASPTDLQSVPFGRSGTPPILSVEPAEGLEPPTH